MPIMNKFQSMLGKKTAQTEASEVDNATSPEIQANEKGVSQITPDDFTKPDNDIERPDEDAQSGVKKIEAVTITWSKSSVYLILVLYVLLQFIWFAGMKADRSLIAFGSSLLSTTSNRAWSTA